MTKPPLLSGKKMKNLLISLTLFLVLFMMAGCSSKLKYVELTKETFLQLDESKVKEVDVVSTGATPAEWKDPAKWRGVYRTVFPINDSVRINTILDCIRKERGSPFSGLIDRKILFVEINVVSVDGKDPENSGKREKIHRNVFSINDTERINTIIDLIRKEKENSVSTGDMKIPFWKILFKTEKVIYFMGIGWDDEFVYGDWWESEDLLLQFKKWGFELPKGESNLPPSKEVYPHPPMDAK